jgi:hypothetical protein
MQYSNGSEYIDSKIRKTHVEYEKWFMVWTTMNCGEPISPTHKNYINFIWFIRDTKPPLDNSCGATLPGFIRWLDRKVSEGQLKSYKTPSGEKLYERRYIDGD